MDPLKKWHCLEAHALTRPRTLSLLHYIIFLMWEALMVSVFVRVSGCITCRNYCTVAIMPRWIIYFGAFEARALVKASQWRKEWEVCLLALNQWAWVGGQRSQMIRPDHQIFNDTDHQLPQRGAKVGFSRPPPAERTGAGLSSQTTDIGSLLHTDRQRWARSSGASSLTSSPTRPPSRWWWRAGLWA